MENIIFFTPQNVPKVAEEIRETFAKMHNLKATLEAFQKKHSLYDGDEWINGISIREAGKDRYIVLCSDDDEAPAIRATLGENGEVRIDLLTSSDLMREAYNIIIHEAAKSGQHIDVLRF